MTKVKSYTRRSKKGSRVHVRTHTRASKPKAVERITKMHPELSKQKAGHVFDMVQDSIKKDIKSEGLSTLNMLSNGEINSFLTIDEFVTLGIVIASLCTNKSSVLICSKKDHPAAHALSAGLSNANVKHSLLNIVPGYVFRKYVNII